MSADPQARESIAIRILWMLLFVLVWQVAELLLGAVVVIQLVYRLIYGAPNGSLMAFGDSLSQYLAQIGSFWYLPQRRETLAVRRLAERPRRRGRGRPQRAARRAPGARRRAEVVKLWLLRHGEAEPHASRDSERRLTAHGRKEVLQSAARLAGLPLDGILASPYVRAQQTAELVREALGLVEPVGTAPWLTPDDDPREVLGFLDERSERNLLLVSHQPLVGALGGLLVHGNRRDPLPMSTASLAELEGDFAAAGLMTLVSLHHPRHG